MAKKKNPPRLIVKDYVYALESDVNLDKVKAKFTVDHFNDKGCRSCEYREDRPCDTCQACANFYGRYKFWTRTKIDGHKYVGVAKGKSDLIAKLLPTVEKSEALDLRTSRPMRTPPEFIMDLYPMQVKATDAMERFKAGVLKSAPRTGKTVMAIKMACAKRQRTLILAHQDDLLEQFLYTIYGKAPDFPTATNAAKVDKKRAKKGMGPVAILAKKDSDFFGDADIVLSTYQRFISKKGGKLLRKVAKQFGMVLVDEVHKGNADCYARVLRTVHPRYLYTVTATPQRKDCLVAGSKVVTPDGYCNIEDVEVGDLVVSQGPDGQRVQPVVEVHVREPAKPLLRVVHEKGVLIATEDHEVWVVNKNAYVPLCEIEEGDELQVV